MIWPVVRVPQNPRAHKFKCETCSLSQGYGLRGVRPVLLGHDPSRPPHVPNETFGAALPHITNETFGTLGYPTPLQTFGAALPHVANEIFSTTSCHKRDFRQTQYHYVRRTGDVRGSVSSLS